MANCNLLIVLMFQAWPPKREHNKFECKECRPPREIDISKEIHDLLSHKPKSSAWICHCGHAELIRECFKTHLRKKHRVEVASTQSCDSAYYCYGIPTFRSMWHCKTCDFRTCYGELKDFHKCEEHKGYHVQPAVRAFEKWIVNTRVPYKYPTYDIRREVVEWLKKRGKPIPEGFYFEEDDALILRAEAIVSRATTTTQSPPGESDETAAPTSPERVRREAEQLELEAPEGPRRRPTETLLPRKRTVPCDNTAVKSYYSKGKPAKRHRGESSTSSERHTAMQVSPPNTRDFPPLSRRVPPGINRLPVYPRQEPRRERMDFLLDPSYLLQFHVPEVKRNVSLYRRYDEYTRFRDRDVTASGLLEGLDTRSPTRVSIDVEPWIGSYLIVNIDGRCIAYATITFHANNPHSTRRDERFRQWNPCNFPLVAELCNVNCRPPAVTHHFALSRLLDRGEYRLVLTPVTGPQPENCKLWVDDTNVRLGVQVEPSTPPRRDPDMVTLQY